MKNLELWNVSTRQLDTNTSVNNSAFCYGYDESCSASAGNIFVCTHNLSVHKINEEGETLWTKNVSKDVSTKSTPINLTYLSLNNMVCLGLSNGELYTIRDTDGSSELAGVSEGGLLALDWSPDQESFVLVTKDYKAILMSCMFEPIKESDLLDLEFGEKQFIAVGWGKKETQFHGREGKQAATIKHEVKADPNTIKDDVIKITWRGDGNFYAVGYSVEGVRQFKVFDKDGNLQYTSEKHHGIEGNLSWRPSGNVIATTQRLPDSYHISFFEKNGLKHGGFPLPIDLNSKVEEITWSSDSEILGLQCNNEKCGLQKILLFTSGNYHWYLKQVLTFNKNQKIIKVLWDNSFEIANGKKLHVILENGQQLSYTWILNINHSQGKQSNDDAIVAVVDGSNVLLTGFRQTVVPPPLAAYTVNVGSNINSVHFAPNGESDPNTFFVCTEDERIIFLQQIHKFPLEFRELSNLKNINYAFPMQYYKWLWLSKDIILAVKIEEDNTHILVELKISTDAIEQKHVYNLPEAVLGMQPRPSDVTKVFLELQNGDILQYSTDTGIDPLNITFNTPCFKFNVVSIGKELYFLGLAHNGHLYINNSLCMSDVSSFFVHTHFLLLTTLRHMLICTELNVAGINSLLDYQKVKSVNINERKIERGAKLVIAVPCDTRTVLQMPRGNLETIQPRSLSLKIIGEFLDSLKYHEAFDIMRKQRINLNLIYDHDPDKFIGNIETFLDSINNNSWLNLFLSDLENIDVTKTMYSTSYSEKKQNGVQDDKISLICNIIRENFNKRIDKDTKVLPLLTTYVKKNTVEELEEALLIIKELKYREVHGEKLPITTDEALKYLLYMVDVNNLFNIALGMYDFDLVLLIANKSQKDPKEYIQMLNEWNEMDENYRKFSINKHLKRFEKAVNNLVMCGSHKHDELRSFVKYHSLYRDVLEVLSPTVEVYKQIGEDFGLYLKLKKQFVEAGIIYERTGNIDRAIECYKLALEWDLGLKLATIHWSREQCLELCWEMITSLKEEKRHRESLIILEQFVQNTENTLKYAIENGQYRTALRLCSQKDKIMPTILDDFKTIKDQIEINRDSFKRHKDRLQVVREAKKNNPTEFYDPTYANKDCDLYSDAGSTVASSRGSSRSFRSSKNRRKHERKVASLKEGSQYEDVALIMALHSLVTTTFELRPTVKEIIIALSSSDRDKEAKTLQLLLERVLKEIKESFSEIWTNELLIEATKATMAAMNLPDGCNILPQGLASLAPHLRIPPIIHDINWKLDGLN